MSFLKHHKHHLRLWLILIAIAAVSGYVGFFWRPETKEQGAGSREQIVATTTVTNDSQFTDNDSNKNAQLETRNQVTETPQSTIRATLIVNDKTYSFAVPSNSTVYDFMKLLREKTEFRFSGKDFGGQLGFFVESINGVKSDHAAHLTWIYYINGKKAQVGISTYRLLPNDIIMWKYEPEEI